MGGGNLFTGIVEEIGKIAGIQKGAKSAVLTIQAEKVLEDVHIGDSIAVNGVCLTVTSFEKNTYTADVMNETLQRSSLGSLSIGSSVNLERAMAANGRFGGHIVSGHIDGTGTITQVKRDDNAIWYTIMAEDSLMNLENDIIGKYVEQLLQYDKKEEKQSRLTKEFLLQAGF